jgi:hypothetical protein
MQQGDIYFKIRFNTTHGDTDLYWRVIIDEQEHLAHAVHCNVETWSEASFDKKANAIKYHMAGRCKVFYIDADRKAMFE